VRLNYGDLITFEEPKLTDDKWHVNLKVDYPVILDDDMTDERMIRFLSVGRVGHLEFDRNYIPTKVTTREECDNALELHLTRWRERTERIVVESTASSIARIGRVREALHPMFVLVHSLAKNEKISFSEIEEMRRPAKKQEYASLLKHDDIMRQIDDGYTYGDTFVSILSKLDPSSRKDADKIKEAVVAYVIEQNYSVIREVFRVNRLDPYTHLESCYYEPSIQANKLLHQKKSTLFSRYNSLYPPFSPNELDLILYDLVKVGSLREVSPDIFLGVEDAFDRMQKKSTMEEFVPLAA
jgi:hypothetical protein